MWIIPPIGAILSVLVVRHRLQQILVIAAVASGACVKQLPPAPTPPAVAPHLDAVPPPSPGQGRLIVDVVDGPAPVQRVQMVPRQDMRNGHSTFRFSETPEVMCAHAPCYSDVALGNVLLGFPVIGRPSDLEIELVHVGPDPSVYRRSLSVYTDNTGGLRTFGILATTFGGISATTGTVLLPVGLARDNSGLTTAGGITLGAGALLLAVGIWALRTDSPTFRPGSSNHFPLGAPTP
jgi:hypothetical protein